MPQNKSGSNGLAAWLQKIAGAALLSGASWLNFHFKI
jgi:hypothetical protein